MPTNKISFETIKPYIQNILKCDVFLIEEIGIGADADIFKIKDINNNLYIVKIQKDSKIDSIILNTLKDKSYKVPNILGNGELADDNYFVLMSYCEGVLYESINKDEKHIYVKSIIDEFKNIHDFPLIDDSQIIHLDKFINEFLDDDKKNLFDYYNTNEDVLFLNKVNLFLKENIPKTNSISILHTDINGNNIFVKEGMVSGIIDWTDAKYGNRLFDYAKLRMYFTQQNDEKSIAEYYKHINLNKEDLEIENIYFILNVFLYLYWYIEYRWFDRAELQMKLLRKVF